MTQQKKSPMMLYSYDQNQHTLMFPCGLFSIEDEPQVERGMKEIWIVGNTKTEKKKNKTFKKEKAASNNEHHHGAVCPWVCTSVSR